MNAIEFVKKYGWERARREISYKGAMMQCNNTDGILEDLQDLVNAYDLVCYFGGVCGVQEIVNRANPNFKTLVGGRVFDYHQLKQAINLVEQCQ